MRQQVKRADDMRHVFAIDLVETQAIERFQQFAGGADALLGSVEQGVTGGLGIDDQYRAIAHSRCQRPIAFAGRCEGCHGSGSGKRSLSPWRRTIGSGARAQQ
ncbi:hypothetical protein D3C71_1895000 [compost metagenome]